LPPRPPLFPYTTLFRSDLSSLVTEQLETEAPSAADDGEEEETQEHIPTPEEIRAAREARLAGYQKVKELNSDMVGWVKIEGTKIDRKSTRLNSSHVSIS